MTWKGEYTHQRDLHYRGRCWGQAPLCAWIYQWHVQPKHTSCCGWELFFVPTAKSKIKIYLHITLSIQVLGWLWEVIRGFVRPALCDTHQYFWKKKRQLYFGGTYKLDFTVKILYCKLSAQGSIKVHCFLEVGVIPHESLQCSNLKGAALKRLPSNKLDRIKTLRTRNSHTFGRRCLLPVTRLHSGSTSSSENIVVFGRGINPRFLLVLERLKWHMS